MSTYSEHVPDDEIINILQEYDIPLTILDDDVLINTYEPINHEEISLLMNVLYQAADKRSPTGRRTPADIERLINIQKVLENSLNKREEQEMNDQQRSNSVQAIAEQERKKTETSVKQEIKEKMNRIHQALQDPRIKGLFYKPDTTRMPIKPEDAFADIKSKPELEKQMMSLTLKGTKRSGGKSRVFRRKNKKMTSKSRRNAQRTQRTQRTRRHRKSSSRRSTRK